VAVEGDGELGALLDALDEGAGGLGLDEAGHVLDADGIAAERGDVLGELEEAVDGVDGAGGVADGALGVLAGLLHSGHGGAEVAHVVEGVEDAEDIEPACGGGGDEGLDDIVGE